MTAPSDTPLLPTPDPETMRDYIDKLTRFWFENVEWLRLCEEARGYIAAWNRRPRPPGEPQEDSSLPKTAGQQVQDGEKKAAMPTLDTAPRDGSSFLSCDLRFGVWSLTVRRVKFVADPSNGHMRTIDMGAWLHISGIDDDWGERDTEGDASWSIAPDDYNNPKDRVWQSLPAAPSKE